MSSVDSGWIDEAGYDADKKAMHVKIGEQEYVYSGITPAKYASFLKAKSKGKWFGKNLREASFKRVQKPKAKR